MSMRCPWCHDLFVPDDDGMVPTHFLDTHEGNVECQGSGFKRIGGL